MDTGGTPTQVGGTKRIPASGGIVNNYKTAIKLPSAAKNLGITTTGTSNFTVEAHGYAAP